MTEFLSENYKLHFCETEEEKTKKMNNMESLENGSHFLGKREAPKADETMNSTEAITNATKIKNMHHRKRSVSIFCFLPASGQTISFKGHPCVLTLNLT
jgi:hypothetical protein